LSEVERALDAGRSRAWEREAGTRLAALMAGAVELPRGDPDRAAPAGPGAGSATDAQELARIERSLRRALAAISGLHDEQERDALRGRADHAAALLGTAGAVAARAAVGVLEPMVS